MSSAQVTVLLLFFLIKRRNIDNICAVRVGIKVMGGGCLHSLGRYSKTCVLLLLADNMTSGSLPEDALFSVFLCVLAVR